MFVDRRAERIKNSNLNKPLGYSAVMFDVLDICNIDDASRLSMGALGRSCDTVK
jgi:hypothetical protein